MNLIHQAENVARHAHAGVYRRCGEAYIEHPRRVAEDLAAAGLPAEVVAAAWLHDVVEDTDITLAELALIFPAAVVDIVDSVTHRDGEDYLTQSVPRAAAHPGGRYVKLADNADNSRPDQLAVFPVCSRVRRERKYLDARHVLLAAVYGAPAAGFATAA
jgi:(p)ppGpp synthase/HD superfamily hydrolase